MRNLEFSVLDFKKLVANFLFSLLENFSLHVEFSFSPPDWYLCYIYSLVLVLS